jgi:hypothetical protein
MPRFKISEPFKINFIAVMFVRRELYIGLFTWLSVSVAYVYSEVLRHEKEQEFALITHFTAHIFLLFPLDLHIAKDMLFTELLGFRTLSIVRILIITRKIIKIRTMDKV